MPNFVPGMQRPATPYDEGAGKWNSKPFKISTWYLKREVRQKAHMVAVAMPDAYFHLMHYFQNSGADYPVDVEDFLDDVPSAKELYDRELAAAKMYVAGLMDGLHTFTSATTIKSRSKQSESDNWFFAMHGYRAWGAGEVDIRTDAKGTRHYQLRFTFTVFDRYNWDNGKSVQFLGITITDEFMGEFHRQGLAREYSLEGSVTNFYEWSEQAFYWSDLTAPAEKSFWESLF